MKLSQNLYTYILSDRAVQVSVVLVVSVVLWSIGAPILFQKAHAANLTSVRDILSTSNLGTVSKHVIQFTNATSTIAGQTIKIQFDPGAAASNFTEAFSAATTTDFAATGFTLVTNAAACSGAASEAYPTGNYNNGTDENIIFTVCPTDTITPGVITITIGLTTKILTNPAAAGSYRIVIGGTQDNAGETRVAVLQNVTLTASVNTSFTFTVTGLATSSALFGNNATSSASSTATALPFGTLASSTIASSTVLAQQLNVTTNARNGFSVTVQENQPPTSSTGATIDLFSNGASTTQPIAWVAPTAILDVPSSYGHFGVTSDDADESQYTANEFAAATKWSGAMDVPKVVFSHTGPSDGVTQNKGKATVGYRIQISDLQEAGTDYTNTLTYVATPTF